MVRQMRVGPALLATIAMAAFSIVVPRAAHAALRVCADPGNMPLSNDRGEGLENKIAAVLAHALNTYVQYYYRPEIERGLTRTTLDADQCDVMLDMPNKLTASLLQASLTSAVSVTPRLRAIR